MEAARAYLDQKDFSSMARGLMGDSRYAPAAQCFDFLKHTVESGRLVVYFSWCHIVESLRYYDGAGPQKLDNVLSSESLQEERR
jgi:hypothetical protein